MLDKGARKHDANVHVDVVVGDLPGVVATREHHFLAIVVLLDNLGLLHPRAEFLVGAHALVPKGRVRHLSLVVDVPGTTNAAGSERLGPGDAHVAVRLLVVNEHVARELLLAGIGRDLGRLHNVKLANLRVAREHLHRVLVVGDLKGLARHYSTASEGAGLKAGDARLEARLGGGAALFVGCAAGWRRA